jgi:hypothetical protein
MRFCPCCQHPLDGEDWAEVVQWMNLAGIDVALDGSMNTKAAARYLGRGKQTLKNWRVLGDGPVFTKDGQGRVRYAFEDLEAFKQSRDEVKNRNERSMPPSQAWQMYPDAIELEEDDV